MTESTPIVLVHGLGSSFEHGWRSVGWVDLISDAGREVVGIDVPGHGTASASHDPADYADVEARVEAMLPSGTIDAIGFSLGGQLLLRIASRHPERFRRLVVIGVGANLFRSDEGRALANAFRDGVDPDDLTARLFVQLAASAGNDPLALAAFLEREQVPFTEEDAARVTCPVLVIIGDRDFAGPADPLVAALPDVRLVTLSGVDHFRAPSDFGCIDAALEFVDAAL